MSITVSAQLETFFSSEVVQPNLIAKVLLEGEDICGFLLLEVNEEESITKQSQTLICDYMASTYSQFECLMQAACAEAGIFGNEYVVVSNYSDCEEQSEWLERFGFHQELLRVARFVEPNHQAAEDPDYRIRRATDNDILFIMRLVAGNSPIYCPANREVDKALIQQGFVNSYTTLSPREKKRVPLVLVDRESDDPVGYIILEPGRVLGGERTLTLYIYDIAVAPEIPRRGLSRFLCGGGEMLLAKMGGGVFYGDISADNDLAVGAQKGLGFTVDSTRWGFSVT